MREKDVFTSEDHLLRGTGPDDFKLNCRGHRRKATGIDMQFFALSQFAFNDRASDVDKGETITFEFLT